MTEFKNLLNTYKEYIENDNIVNYDDCDFDVLIDNINDFERFLEENEIYNNNTYLYFKCIYLFCNEEYEEMLEYINILNEDPNYLVLIGYYYQFLENNYDLMKKYYLIAIELNNHPKAINYLAYYYQYIEKDYNLMEKYYLMGIELNNADAMNNLGLYYYVKKNYEMMKKYYIMAIENFNYTYSIDNFKFYCRKIENNESNYYKYVYLPRILTLILCTSNRKNKNKRKLYLPEELLNQIIFTVYMQF